MADRLPTIQGLTDGSLEPLWRVALAVAALATGIVVLIDPLINLLIVFGVPITPEQSDAIVGFIRALTAIGAPLAVASESRPKVTPAPADTWSDIDPES